ncbi:BnaC02g34280D [Brassica napus]|uniref:BnaC02g34280D protein n=1 Tax=Brassica napus TaxID=3708 RepID=A0A078FSC6_BRANA|nr:BnaC02g34280D [Brassica napus]
MGSIDEETSLLEAEQSLLQEEVKLYAEDGSVDINGNPPLKQKTGNWKACPFIFANECCERLAYYGIAKNLITYFTNELHETNVSAARHVMTWQGTCYITPLLGALIADAYWGRYRTIACFSAIYFSGMVALTLSASVPGLKPGECVGSICPPATMPQQAVLFSGLYLIALGTGGIKPCVSSFGADQFDQTDPSERVRKASFFNWYYFSINVGAFVSSTLLVWVQENCGWELGFMIPTVFMGLATASFFFGTPLYRFQKPRGSPITRACQVLVAAYRNMNLKLPEENHTPLSEVTDEEDTIHDPWKLCTVTQVEEVKIILRLFPIWSSGIIFSVLHSQIYTLYVQQGRSMQRTIGSFEIPPATLGMFDTASVLITVPIYDRLIVPFVRRFTGLAKGFTDLQRMGIGLFVSVLSLAVAAIVETFFYEQSPDTMRSLCNAWALLTTTLGNYLSSMIVTAVACLSGKDDGWIPSDNLNNGHLDYFFWLLVCLGSVNIPVFVFFSVRYTQKKV